MEKWEFPSDHLLCLYKIRVRSDASVPNAAKKIATYASTGLRAKAETWEKFGAKIISRHELSSQDGIIIVAYPPETFDIETGGISSILSVIAGWNISVSDIVHVRICDIFLPEKIVSKFPGPQVSQEQINHRLSVKRKECYLHIPVYPRLGATAEEYERTLSTLLENGPLIGPDIIADSELLFSPSYCPVRSRITSMQKYNKELVEKTSSMKDKLETLGCKTLFFVNVTGTPIKALENATLVKDAGLDGIIVNALTTGFSLLEDLRMKFPDLIIYAHANMHAILTRGERTGMNFEVLIRLFKLAGADIIYTGAPYGSLDLIGSLEHHIANIQKYNNIVRSKIFNIQPAIPCIGGGINLGNLEVNLKLAGIPLEVVVGDGLYGYPKPLSYTIKLLKKAIACITLLNKTMWSDKELLKNRQECNEYFKTNYVDSVAPENKELRESLQKFSTLRLGEA
jgi:ribulose 1,5-bisphosphate carboxylase large subunit-like protein